MPQVVTANIIFLSVLLDLVMRVLLNADLVDFRSCLFIAARIMLTIAQCFYTKFTDQTWISCLIVLIMTYIVQLGYMRTFPNPLKYLKKDDSRSTISALLAIFIMYYCVHSYTLREEPDYVTDGLFIFLLAICFKQNASQIKDLRTMLYFILAICCVKGAYFYDNTVSEELVMPNIMYTWKQKVQSLNIISTYIPVIFMFIIECRIIKYLQFTPKISMSYYLTSFAVYIALI
jgi:hypothetical protein